MRLARAILLSLAASAVLGLPQLSHAQSFPAEPIHIIVPFGAGGSPDVISRVVADGLGRKYGKPVVVEDKPGAAGVIGTELVKKAPPDGYTLLVADSGVLAINKALYATLPYDPVNDFTPVTQMFTLPFILYASTALHVRNASELIALMKAKPNAVNYGTAGNGSAQQLCAALFLKLAGVEAVGVPYTNSFAIGKGIISGEIQLACAGGKFAGQAMVDAGKAVPIVVASDTRTASFPDVPTLQEAAGIAGYVLAPRMGLLAPKNTPRPVVEQLSNDVAAILHSGQVQAMLAAQGVDAVTEGPDRYAAAIRDEIDRYARLVKLAGAQVQK
jgi:tripartite-type tricarboxylate transporter receptor subunit TctC